jgi:hypothetical protein
MFEDGLVARVNLARDVALWNRQAGGPLHSIVDGRNPFLATDGDSFNTLISVRRDLNAALGQFQSYVESFEPLVWIGSAIRAIVARVREEIAGCLGRLRALNDAMAALRRARRALASRRHACVEEDSWYFVHGCHPPDLPRRQFLGLFEAAGRCDEGLA